MGNSCCQVPAPVDDVLVDAAPALVDAACTVADLDVLQEQLAGMEGDREAEDRLFQSLQTSGSMMIATLRICEPDHAKHMKLVGYLRALLAARVWTEEVMLVKPDECKFFVFSASPYAILHAALQLAQLAKDFPAFLSGVVPELGPDQPEPLAVKIGVEAGQVLLLPGDCYGDPVNKASKLGEDIAMDGQLCLGAAFTAVARADPKASELLSRFETTEACTEISKVHLQYLVAPLATAAVPLGAPLPDCTEFALACARSGFEADPHSETLAVFVSDMSGFTSLTKKHGILHYLRLVLNVRQIFAPLVQLYGGRIVKYDGDNIIATFPTCHDALVCTAEAWSHVSEYSAKREEDFQIRMGCALCYGDVLLQGNEIMGESFDLSFHLAEEVSEVNEVLVTQRFREQLLKEDKLPTNFKVSSERHAEHALHGQLSHHCIDFK